jgi:hypothetical protein
MAHTWRAAEDAGTEIAMRAMDAARDTLVGGGAWYLSIDAVPAPSEVE